MHVCETLRERQSSAAAHFYPVQGDQAGRETKPVGRPAIFSLLARKLAMPFQPEVQKKQLSLHLIGCAEKHLYKMFYQNLHL